jgi:hypothetical protein
MTTGADTHFELTNGALAKNVNFDLGAAATIGANSDILQGSIRAEEVITLSAQPHVYYCDVVSAVSLCLKLLRKI